MLTSVALSLLLFKREFKEPTRRAASERTWVPADGWLRTRLAQSVLAKCQLLLLLLDISSVRNTLFTSGFLNFKALVSSKDGILGKEKSC